MDSTQISMAVRMSVPDDVIDDVVASIGHGKSIVLECEVKPWMRDACIMSKRNGVWTTRLSYP